MTRDRTWVFLDDHGSVTYRQGCEEFLEFAFSNAAIDEVVRCPCRDCLNRKFGNKNSIHKHLLWRGMYKDYGKALWTFHNEHAIVEVVQPLIDDNHVGQDITYDRNGRILDLLRACTQEDHSSDPVSESSNFRKLVEEANNPLYDGCKNYSKLSFVIELYQIKSRGKMSDKTFTDTLKLLKKALPQIDVPESFYETKKLISKLGCGYIKIDACENDCMLFWNEDKNLDACKICNTSRWKVQREDHPGVVSNCKRVPRKVLRYFSLKDRLQRIFLSRKRATDMRWHIDFRCNDGTLRHPADSLAWKEFDKKHESFSIEHRNLRLGLAADGFNPFGLLSSNYSTWPVILVVYNLPPDLCMQSSTMILSTLISGSKGPKNNIDVYLQPLIVELRELWIEGIETYDASRKQYFNMKAALLWTINDFPAYGNLSGWSTSGYLACPSCADETVSERLWKSNKQCYMGHSRFPVEGAPPHPTGESVLSKTEGIHTVFGAGQRVPDETQWRKQSIFFQLPYWKFNLIRHNLDVMHIEKNIGELLLKWLLSTIESVYNVAKEDISKMKKPPCGRLGPRFPLLVPKLYKYHRVSKEQKKAICGVISKIKVPDGYSSNISRSVHDKKLVGLKSHDYHVLMQDLLPLAIRNAGLPNNLVSTIADLCSFFRDLCSKTNNQDDFEKLKRDIVVILCKLEKLFPPAFFVVMMHLAVHLPHEAMIGGPVHFRWMYPFERYLGHLKSFVRNKRCPEGSIAECYITEECLNFCSLFMEDSQNSDGHDKSAGLPIFEYAGKSSESDGLPKYRTLSYDEMEQAHNYCLFNCDELSPFMQEHLETVKHRVPTSDVKYKWRIQCLQEKEFRHWLRSRVGLLRPLNDDLLAISQSSEMKVQRYKSFSIHGYLFRTKSAEQLNKTQNSGVVVNASTTSFATTKDSNPTEGNVTYYGVIKDILELSLSGDRKIVLFECEWADTEKTRTDAHGFTLVDFTRTARHANPFVLPSQVMQVFYVEDPYDSPWKVPVITRPRQYNDFVEENEGRQNDNNPLIPTSSASRALDLMEE